MKIGFFLLQGSIFLEYKTKCSWLKLKIEAFENMAVNLLNNYQVLVDLWMKASCLFNFCVTLPLGDLDFFDSTRLVRITCISIWNGIMQYLSGVSTIKLHPLLPLVPYRLSSKIQLISPSKSLILYANAYIPCLLRMNFVHIVFRYIPSTHPPTSHIISIRYVAVLAF
jgi:hypothetical protein